jgi:hypothetical protein
MILVDPGGGGASLESAGQTRNKLEKRNISVTIQTALPSFTPTGRKPIKVDIFVHLASTSAGVKF